MISLDIAGARFNLRAAGVCVQDGFVLLHRAEIDDWFSLPGGRVEIGESTADALQRELLEELGPEAGAQVGPLLWIIENHFTLEGKPQHEIGFYYQFTLGAASPWRDRERIHRGHEGHLTLFFQWFPLDALDSLPLPLYPSLLRRALRDLPATPQHIIHRDGAS